MTARPSISSGRPASATRNGRYFLYYSVGRRIRRPAGSRRGRGSARGPYRDSGRPLVTGDKAFEAIDPMVFTDRKSGKTYLYVGGSAGARLRVWELKPDMVSIARE